MFLSSLKVDVRLTCQWYVSIIHVIAWCHQATSHYLNQCWPRHALPCGITRLFCNMVNTSMIMIMDYCLMAAKSLPELMLTHCQVIESSNNNFKWFYLQNGCLFIQVSTCSGINTLRPRQNGRHFADDMFKCIFLNGNVRISIKISLKFLPKDPINSIPSLVQIMAWRQPGNKPLSEPMMVSLLTHVCVTRPQWVKHQMHFFTCSSLWVYLRYCKK